MGLDMCSASFVSFVSSIYVTESVRFEYLIFMSEKCIVNVVSMNIIENKVKRVTDCSILNCNYSEGVGFPPFYQEADE